MVAIAERIFTKVVVDTGPLFTALTLDYIRNGPPAKRQSVLSKNGVSSYLKGSLSREESFLQLFGSIRTILTTSHVIGELQGLQKLKGEDQKGFWACGMNLLSSKNLDENLRQLLFMNGRESLREGVYRIGPTDMGLIDLARSEGCVLLTDDRRTLFPLAVKVGVDCQIVEDLVVAT